MEWSKENILKAIGSYLIIYLKSGKLNINSYIEELDLNIEKIEELLKIHFLLLDDVETYIKRLNDNIHKIEVEKTFETYGEIKGKVLWNKTLEARLNTGKEEIFISKKFKKDSEILEIKVLQEFIGILYKLVNDKNRIEIIKRYKNLDINQVNKFYKKKLSKLKASKNTFRDINKVKKSKNIFYKDTAFLLEKYLKIIDLEEREISKLMETTFIEVISETTLFELYWVFKIIEEHTDIKKLHILNYGDTKVAEWENDNEIYMIYHNSTGSNEVSFKVDISEIEGTDNWYLNKQLEIIEAINKSIVKLYPNKKEKYRHIYRGRPDIIIEIRDKTNMKLKEIEIYEVKYTENEEYIIAGLRQLEEYKKFFYSREKVNIRKAQLISKLGKI